MGFLNSLKKRVSLNLKLTRLSFMSAPEIIAFCQSQTQAERVALVQGIESQLKWQGVLQVSQVMFATNSVGGGVSSEALDMVKDGQIYGGLALMNQENQISGRTQWGMAPGQSGALNFALMVLKGIEMHEAGEMLAAQKGANISS